MTRVFSRRQLLILSTLVVLLVFLVTANYTGTARAMLTTEVQITDTHLLFSSPHPSFLPTDQPSFEIDPSIIVELPTPAIPAIVPAAHIGSVVPLPVSLTDTGVSPTTTPPVLDQPPPATDSPPPPPDLPTPPDTSPPDLPPSPVTGAPTSYLYRLFPTVLAEEVPVRLAKVELYDPRGQLSVLPLTTTYHDGKWSVSVVREDQPIFTPGEYRLHVEIFKDSILYLADHRFTWGVLAINTNKSVYLPHEEAYLQMATLDAGGHTLCREPLELTITDPAGHPTTLRTNTGDITFGPDCGNDNITDEPDYQARHQVNVPGTYTLKLHNLHTGYEVTDSFAVQTSVPFDVERIGATRINPFLASYRMRLKVTARQDFTGNIVETVPWTFDLTPRKTFQTFWLDDHKEIRWPLTLAKGESVSLEYDYRAPNLSPELYLLGPLRFKSESDQEDFKEERRWQLAGDSVGATVLTSGGDTSGSAPYTTASITPSANKLLLAFVMNTGTPTVPVPSLSGNGLTWEQVNTTTYTATTPKRVSVFRAMGASPTSGAVTIDMTANTGVAWIITEFGNVSTLGSNGSVAVVQNVATTTNSSVTSLVATLPSAISNINNATVGGFGQNAVSSGTAFAPGSGYSELAEAAYATPNTDLQAEWRADGNTVVDVTMTSSPGAGIALELAHATSTVSGTANGNNGATVKVAVNGVAQAQTATIASGAWSIANVALTSGDVVTTWVDGVADSNESTAVTKYDGSGDITGVVLNTNALSIGSGDDQSLTVTNLGLYDNDDDEDIIYAANSGALTLDPGGVYSDETLSILSSNTLTIGGTESLTTDNVNIAGILASGGAGTFTISGSWTNTGAFTTSTETITFTSTGSESINSTGASSASFYNLIFNGSGGQWTLGSSLTATNDLTITAGTLTGAQNLTVQGGDLTCGVTCGTINLTSGTTTLSGIGNFGKAGLASNWTFNNLAFDGATVAYGTGTTTATSTLTISDNQSLDAGAKTWILSGTGTPFSIGSGATFTASSSNFTYSGDGAVTVAAATYSDLTFSPTLTGDRVYTGGGAINASSTLDLDPTAASALSLTFNLGGTTVVSATTTVQRQSLATAVLDTTGANYTLTSGALNISTGGTLTANNSVINVGGNWWNTGTFTAGGSTVTLNTATTAHVTGANTFYNLTVTHTAAKEVDFSTTSSHVVHVTNTFNVAGSSGNLIKLYSDTAGTKWHFHPTGTASVDYADVKDGGCESGAITMSPTHTTDSGNNDSCWGLETTTDSGNSGSNSGGSSGGGRSPIQIPPPGGFGVLINGGALTTYRSLVSLSLEGGINTRKLLISTRPDFQNAIEYLYQPEIYFNLCAGAPLNYNTDCFAGLYTVYVKFVGQAGMAVGEAKASIKYFPPSFHSYPAPLTKSPGLVAPPVLEVFSGHWQLLAFSEVDNFVFAPLPTILNSLIQKFPTLSRTFVQTGVRRFSDVTKLEGVNLTLPGVAEVTAQQPLPTDLIFARGAGDSIDLNTSLHIDSAGEITQTLNSFPGQALDLVIRPEHPVDQILGYLVWYSDETKTTARWRNLPWLEWLVTPLLAATKPVENKLVLEQFEYIDPDHDGLYTATINTPQVVGSYDLITTIDYTSVDLGYKEIRLRTVVDPEGYVYENVAGKELRLPEVTVSLYWFNDQKQAFELWPATAFHQHNPQITGVSGDYAFLVPPGRYYLAATADKYQTHQGEPFVVERGSGIHQNIELKPVFQFPFASNWQLVLLLVIALLVVYNLFK